MSPLQNFVVLPSLVPSAEQKLNQVEPGNEASGGLVLSPTPPRTHQHNLKEVMNRHNLSALFLLPSTFLPPLSLPPLTPSSHSLLSHSLQAPSVQDHA